MKRPTFKSIEEAAKKPNRAAIKLWLVVWGLMIIMCGTLIWRVWPEPHTCTLPSPEYKVTAYCPNECCCGRWADGFFANGEPVGGLAIAAPKSIPFGTVLFVPGYGTATVKDRGGSITGNRLDVYFNTHQEALDWGVQCLTVLEME